MTTELLIERSRWLQPADRRRIGSRDPLLDDFFDACVAGWQNSFEGIRNYIHNNPAE
jgi:hypothetical protein